jgi:hypothetical protein
MGNDDISISRLRIGVVALVHFGIAALARRKRDDGAHFYI